MNVSDDRLALPAPECCRKCIKRHTWKLNGVERNQCLHGHIMAEGCMHQRLEPLGLDTPPWEAKE